MPNLYITLKSSFYLNNLSLPIKGVQVILTIKNFKAYDFSKTIIEREEKDDSISIDEYQDYWERREFFRKNGLSYDSLEKIYNDNSFCDTLLDNSWVDKIKFK